MWRVHDIAPSATSTQLVVHALPAVPAGRGGNLSNSCTQFPLETVIQLLKEAGVVLADDASASASDKPSEVAVADADNLDLVNMPATFDYEGDETAWQQGLLPGEVEPQLSELELSDSDSDSSVGSILSACLDGFNGDAWMSDVEGANNDIQVGEAVGVNDPSDIPWRTTPWRAGAQPQTANVANNASVLLRNAVISDLPGAALGGNDIDGDRPVGGCNEGEKNVTGINVLLTEAQKKEKKQLQKKKYRSKSHRGMTNTVGTSHHNVNRTEQQLAKFAKLSKFEHYNKYPQKSQFCVFSGVTLINYLI